MAEVKQEKNNNYKTIISGQTIRTLSINHGEEEICPIHNLVMKVAYVHVDRQLDTVHYCERFGKFMVSPKHCQDLKKMLKKEIDIDKVYSSNIEFGLVSYSIKSKKALEVFKEDIPKKDFIDYLLASSCFPIYKAQKIKDEEYFDGFFHDNMPINMLIKKGYKNIIAIDIGSVNANKRLIDKNTYVKVVKASENLGGTFEFNKEKIKFNINLGYLDTMKSFNKLKGHMYFFRPYEFNRILHKFTLEQLYGLEYAAEIYGIDKYRVYTCKEFLDLLLESHNKATQNYNKVRESLDFKKLLKGGKEIKNIVDKGLGLCLVEDMINNKPSFRNIKIINKLFSTYFLAADAMIELENL